MIPFIRHQGLLTISALDLIGHKEFRADDTSHDQEQATNASEIARFAQKYHSHNHDSKRAERERAERAKGAAQAAK